MIDFNRIAEAIFDGAVAALGEGAQVIEARAKQLAPVRALFSEGHFNIRFKSIGEIEADRGIRAQMGLGPERARGPHRARTAFGAPPPRRWRLRQLGTAQEMLANYDAEVASRRAGRPAQPTVLSRRGASEVRTKRAVFSTWQHLKVGGRLRGEIYSSRPVITGKRAEAWVISPTPYAKYMEFGTRHAAAHPFLRPAMAESRAEIVSRIAAAVAEASRTSATGTTIDVVVRL